MTTHGSARDADDIQTRSGDLPQRLHGLFEQHAGFVYRCLRQLGARDSELDDALERVFAGAYRHLLEHGARPTRGWLYAACKRAAPACAYEPRALEPAQVKDAGGFAFGSQLLALLPEAQREVFILYEVEDMPLPEIALALGRPERSVRALLLEARARIVGEVERLAAEASDV